MNQSQRSTGLEVIRSYVVGQARLGYPTFEPGPNAHDIILTSFPKSGSTWTSYLLHQIRSAGDDNFDDIKNEVIDITPGHWDPNSQPFSLEQRFQPHTFKTHGSYARSPKGAQYIYISRDPKDIFWSLYQFIHDLLGIEKKVSIDQFYKDFFIERFGTGHDIGNVWDHLLGWFSIHGQENMLWLHYEDLVEHREPIIRVIADYMGVKLEGKVIDCVLHHSSMEHMRGISERLNPSPDNYVGQLVAGFGDLTQHYARRMSFGKLRRGIPGDGEKDLPLEILQELDKEWRERITPQLGFTDYAAMKVACSII